MDIAKLKNLLRQVQDGETSVEAAMSALKDLPFRDVGAARVDTHRPLRCGFAEVLYCEGKTTDEALAVAREIISTGAPFLATRASREMAEAVAAEFPHAVFHERARCITCVSGPVEKRGLVAVISAGTSDAPVAEEAAVTAEMLGARVERASDVGVAGIHRLLAEAELLRRANVLVVVAGMEGALPSVVGGLTDVPVIAVPTSVGYGASFGGLSALLAMLNSCAAGVAVVNIDNGFGAGYMAAMINRKIVRNKAP
jgi:NCAIR mutase (PurE)-related protein